jgi:nucleoid DNA-binding protein
LGLLVFLLVVGSSCIDQLEDQEMATNKSPKSRTKSETYQALAVATGLNRKQVAAVLDGLAQIIREELSKKGPGIFTLPGLLKIKRISKPATKTRTIPNPFKPGEMMTVKGKPARNVVKAQPLKSLKEMVK